jgi:hypothetical protein
LIHVDDVKAVIARGDDDRGSFLVEENLIRVLHGNGLAVNVNDKRRERGLKNDLLKTLQLHGKSSNSSPWHSQARTGSGREPVIELLLPGQDQSESRFVRSP